MDERENRLIRQAQQGSTSAFAQVVAMHDRRVLQLACQLLSSERDAEDVYQDIFLQVFRKLSSFRFESEFSTWLHRIVVNHCINFRKKRERRRYQSLDAPHGDEESEVLPQPEDPGQDPERALLNRELGERITAALDSLSGQQRAVFVLRHFHGHKVREIAEILSCAEGTVKNYLFRATQQLQRKLQAYHEDEI
jgi:RNA polymerase sigma-70 factor (ECF subfamily)